MTFCHNSCYFPYLLRQVSSSCSMVQYSSSSFSRHHRIRVLELWKKIDESKKPLETWEIRLTSPRRPTIQIQRPGLKRPNPAQIQRQQTKKKNPNICATVFEGAMGRTTQEPRTYLQIWKLPWILGSNKSTQKQQILYWCIVFKKISIPTNFPYDSAALDLQHQILQKQRLITTYL
jgi:hypothetical protein